MLKSTRTCKRLVILVDVFKKAVEEIKAYEKWLSVSKSLEMENTIKSAELRQQKEKSTRWVNYQIEIERILSNVQKEHAIRLHRKLLDQGPSLDLWEEANFAKQMYPAPYVDYIKFPQLITEKRSQAA